MLRITQRVRDEQHLQLMGAARRMAALQRPPGIQHGDRRWERRIVRAVPLRADRVPGAELRWYIRVVFCCCFAER